MVGVLDGFSLSGKEVNLSGKSKALRTGFSSAESLLSSVNEM